MKKNKVIICPATIKKGRSVCICLTEDIKCTGSYKADGTLIPIRKSLPYQGIVRMTMKEIKDIGKTLLKIDHEKVAKALGATLITKGTKVRMSQASKDALIKNGSHEHIEEFGDCIGIVEGPMDFGTQKGPEVDVRWMPSRLRYGYLPKELEIVSKEECKQMTLDKWDSLPDLPTGLLAQAHPYINADNEDDKYFTETINWAQEYIEKTDQELANDMLVSRSTIGRWKAGKNRPHKFVRKSVFKYLQKEVFEAYLEKEDE